MNKTQIAKRIGKDPKTLGNWEKNNPELYNLLKKGLEAEKKDKNEYVKEYKEINYKEKMQKIIDNEEEKIIKKIYYLSKAII